MRVVVVTPPEPVVTLAEAKQHLRVRHGDDDTLIPAYVAAATGHIDGPAGWLQRAIGVQTLEAGLNGFIYDRFKLPCPPLISIESIKYEDQAGVEQTLDPALYEVRDEWIGSAWGASWPSTRTYRGPTRTVKVQYKAGYVDVPAPIKAAILLMTGDLYANRETASGVAASSIPMSTTVENLLSPFRVYR